MSTTIARTAATLAAIAASSAVLAAAPAAHAETTTITDETGDAGRFSDISTVTTRLTQRLATVTTTFARRAHYADQLVVYLDVDGRIGGPEYAAIIDTDAFGDEQTSYEVRETRNFRILDEATCTPDDAVVESDGQDSITLPVPVRCLVDTGHVRVSVETTQYVGGRGDYAPRRHRFGPNTYTG